MQECIAGRPVPRARPRARECRRQLLNQFHALWGPGCCGAAAASKVDQRQEENIGVEHTRARAREGETSISHHPNAERTSPGGDASTCTASIGAAELLARSVSAWLR
jgi:hypothetical protein